MFYPLSITTAFATFYVTFPFFIYLFIFFVRFIYFVLCARAKRFSRAQKVYALFNCCRRRRRCRRDLIKIAESTSKKHV